MRGRSLILAFLWAATGAAAAGAAVSKDVTTLPWRRPVVVPEGTAREWIEVREDSVLAAGAAFGFPDVRIVDGEGTVIPVAILEPTLRETRYGEERGLPLRWERTGRSAWWEAEADLGADRPPSLVFELLTGPDAGYRPTYYASPDRVHWSTVDPLDVTSRAIRGQEDRYRLRLDEPDRYLSVKVMSGDRPRISGLVVVPRETRSTPREAVPFTVRRSGFDGRTWEATVTLDGPARAVAGLLLEVPRATPASFPVGIRAELPDGGYRWIRTESVPDWSSTTLDTLLFGPVRTRTLRVEVGNADPPHAPVEIRGVVAVPTRWLFPPSARERVWLAYGDPYLEPRDWEMEGHALWQPATVLATLGAPEPNPVFEPPGFGLQWLKRHPAVAGAAMIGLLVLVGIIVLRGARSSRPAA